MTEISFLECLCDFGGIAVEGALSGALEVLLRAFRKVHLLIFLTVILVIIEDVLRVRKGECETKS